MPDQTRGAHTPHTTPQVVDGRFHERGQFMRVLAPARTVVGYVRAKEEDPAAEAAAAATPAAAGSGAAAAGGGNGSGAAGPAAA